MIKQINLGPTFKLLLMVLMMFTTALRTDHTFNPIVMKLITQCYRNNHRFYKPIDVNSGA